MWKNFKEKKPYDWRKKVDGNLESDPDICYFIYKYINRPSTMNSGPFVGGPSAYKEGCFVGYENQMLPMEDGKYQPCYHMEVLVWISEENAEKILKSSWQAMELI